MFNGYTTLFLNLLEIKHSLFSFIQVKMNRGKSIPVLFQITLVISSRKYTVSIIMEYYLLIMYFN